MATCTFFGHRNCSPSLAKEISKTITELITKRNKWMLQQSEYVVTYVRHSSGGAARYFELSKKLKKAVFEI